MCTAFTYRAGGGYMARNLDQHTVYGQQVAVTPRRAPLTFRHQPPVHSHYAMIGAAVMREGVPLYFEAVNEEGLAVAALAFEGECRYAPSEGREGELAPFELIPFVLSCCADVTQAKELLESVKLTAIPFSAEDPLTPLHWMITDRKRTLVAEPLCERLELLNDPVEVLTNSPCLAYQLRHLAQFASLRTEEPSHRMELTPYHRGYGMLGLPGDLTPSSRFVRAAFLKDVLPSDSRAEQALLDSVRVLDSVAFLQGAVPVGGERFAITQYSCVCDLTNAVYYYKTYGDPTLRAVSLTRAPLNEVQCSVFPMVAAFEPIHQN